MEIKAIGCEPLQLKRVGMENGHTLKVYRDRCERLAFRAGKPVFTYAIVFILFVGTSTLSNAQKRYYYGEEEFKKSVPISTSIEKVLRKDGNFQNCRPVSGESPKGRFEAMTFDLNRDGSAEVFVKGACGNSSTSYFYWVLTNRRGESGRVLFDAALGFEIRNKRSTGWSNITFSGCTASTCFYREFAFNGRIYLLKRQWQRANS
jgi:hypothetical protein